MCEIWCFVCRFSRLTDEPQRLVDVAAAFCDTAARLHRQIEERVADAGGGQRCVRTFVELDLQRATPLHRRPRVSANHRHALRDLHDVCDASDGLRLRRVEASDRATEDRTARDLSL